MKLPNWFRKFLEKSEPAERRSVSPDIFIGFAHGNIRVKIQPGNCRMPDRDAEKYHAICHAIDVVGRQTPAGPKGWHSDREFARHVIRVVSDLNGISIREVFYEHVTFVEWMFLVDRHKYQDLAEIVFPELANRSAYPAELYPRAKNVVGNYSYLSDEELEEYENKLVQESLFSVQDSTELV